MTPAHASDHLAALPARIRPDLLAHEHAVLVRQWGKAQARVSRHMWDQEARLQAMTQALVRLRGELVCCHTAALWGMGLPTTMGTTRHTQADPVRRPKSPALAEAAHVICNTGCTGHAHHWLADDGHCRLRDQVCIRAELSGRPAGSRQQQPTLPDYKPAGT